MPVCTLSSALRCIRACSQKLLRGATRRALLQLLGEAAQVFTLAHCFTCVLARSRVNSSRLHNKAHGRAGSHRCALTTSCAPSTGAMCCGGGMRASGCTLTLCLAFHQLHC